MASAKNVEPNEVRENYRHHPRIIYIVRGLPIGTVPTGVNGSRVVWKYYGRRYGSDENIPIDAYWLNSNNMDRTWRKETIWSHPGNWFQVPIPARTKQTALNLKGQ